jgi:hypothetical protein
VHAASLQQIEGADHVAHDEGLRPVDRPVDVGFGRQMNDHVRLMAMEDIGQRRPIAQIGLLERVPRISRQWSQSGGAGCVAELVQINDPAVGRVPQQPADRRADEAGAAGHQNGPLF